MQRFEVSPPASKMPKSSPFSQWCKKFGPKKLSLDSIIEYLEKTKEEYWYTDYCRSQCGTKNCLLGHLFEYGGGERGQGSNFVDFFEEQYATSYMFFPVNDGKNPLYQQKTPKQRILAYLRDLRDGKQKKTYELLASYEK